MDWGRESGRSLQSAVTDEDDPGIEPNHSIRQHEQRIDLDLGDLRV